MELVDPNVNVNEQSSKESNSTKQPAESVSDKGNGNHQSGREGWGTAEATEMITNNLFYITVKVRN